MFPVQHFRHGLLGDPHHGACGHCVCRVLTKTLPGESTFSKEIAFAPDPYRGLFSALRHNGELHSSVQDVKHIVRRTPLEKDRFVLAERYDPPSAIDRAQEFLGIEAAWSPHWRSTVHQDHCRSTSVR